MEQAAIHALRGSVKWLNRTINESALDKVKRAG